MKFTANSQDYILSPIEPPLKISSSETLPISSRISVGLADSKTSSDNVVLTAMHLQTMKTTGNLPYQVYHVYSFYTGTYT